ncbi:diacylglycerol kinase (ATP) [Kosakonia radicincitans]|uniref:diacylglycerol kinase n=1 Tax=Kosakonia radicincitans TaxID=283686 RepID=UPI0009A87CB5|nr:diacylglycerol kinase [Kosakonia radicincitans]SKC19000.1 diacylglycerol kinase (ATP) [Kosakonia radicincitans]
MSNTKKQGINRLMSSIYNSWVGIVDAFFTEAAFRQLIVINIPLLLVALCVDVSKAERLLLIMSGFLMLVVELINTAIETVVDRISLDIHPLSKRAKDIGGGAQLVTIVMAIIVWFVVLT